MTGESTAVGRAVLIQGLRCQAFIEKNFSVRSELLHSFVDGNSNWESKGTFPVRSLVS